MTDESLDAFVKQHSLFADLDAKDQQLIATLAATKDFGAQQLLFRSGEPAEEFYLVRDGKVAIEIPAVSGSPLAIQSLGPGSITGWSWLIPPYRWNFDARAVEPSSVVAIAGKKLLGHCEGDPKLGYELMKRFAMLMGERLQAARERVIEEYRAI